MKLLSLITWEEEFNYSSDKSPDSFKADLDDLFHRKEAWHKSINLIGDFTSDKEFLITPRFQSISIRNFEREEAFLKGRIYSDEIKRTRVSFKVRPNSIYPIFFFLFPVIGLVFWNVKFDENTNFHFFSSAPKLFAIAVPIITLVSAFFAKTRIKNRFVKAFNLRPVN